MSDPQGSALTTAEPWAGDLSNQLQVALAAGGLGMWRWELSTNLMHWDDRVQELFGFRPGEFDGTLEAWGERLHPDDRDAITKIVNESVRAGRAYVIQHRVVWPDGTIRWLKGNGRVILNADGSVVGAIGCTADVTEQSELEIELQRTADIAHAAAQRERLSRERLEFLASINDALAAATDTHEAMRNVTQAAVPRLGDWCSIWVLPEANSLIPDVETAHVDPAMVTRARELRSRVPYDPRATTGIPHIIRTGRTEFFPEIDDTIMSRPEVTDEARTMVSELSIRSVISVPLVKRDRVLGAMQFVNSDSSRTYTDDDVLLAEAVGGRIASALENLRLVEHQRLIATTLQMALLPVGLPTVPGVDVAVRYWAAGEGTEVGGDFYDVFEVDGSTWAVVIGDVCGTGPSAAATTGLARHTIRASAWHGANHDEVLRELNRAILQSGTLTFCTALFATVVPESGGGVTFDLASGGHPLPIVCRRSGATELVGHFGTLVGALEESRSITTSTLLLPGDAVVLYTDGVTDVRPPHGLEVDELQRMVARSCDGATSAEQVADRLRAEISGVLPLAERDDDIALLVLRVAD